METWKQTETVPAWLHRRPAFIFLGDRTERQTEMQSENAAYRKRRRCYYSIAVTLCSQHLPHTKLKQKNKSAASLEHREKRRNLNACTSKQMRNSIQRRKTLWLVKSSRAPTEWALWWDCFWSVTRMIFMFQATPMKAVSSCDLGELAHRITWFYGSVNQCWKVIHYCYHISLQCSDGMHYCT